MTKDRYREMRESSSKSGMYPRTCSNKEQIRHSENLCKEGIWNKKKIDGMIWYIWNNNKYQ